MRLAQGLDSAADVVRVECSGELTSWTWLRPTMYLAPWRLVAIRGVQLVTIRALTRTGVARRLEQVTSGESGAGLGSASKVVPLTDVRRVVRLPDQAGVSLELVDGHGRARRRVVTMSSAEDADELLDQLRDVLAPESEATEAPVSARDAVAAPVFFLALALFCGGGLTWMAGTTAGSGGWVRSFIRWVGPELIGSMTVVVVLGLCIWLVGRLRHPPPRPQFAVPLR